MSGFLSGSETALTATSKPRIRLKHKKGDKRAKFAFIGMSVSVIAIVLGGSNIEVESFDQGAFSISLDWLILEILALSFTI